MGHLLNLLRGTVFIDKLSFYDCRKWLHPKTCSYTGKFSKFRKYRSWELAGHLRSSLNHEVIYCLGALCDSVLMFRFIVSLSLNYEDYTSVRPKSEVLDIVSNIESEYFEMLEIIYIHNGVKLNAFPHIQTLRLFPKGELSGKVVMVRFSSNMLMKQESDQKTQSVFSSLFTIKYLQETGAKVILVSDWNANNSELLHSDSVSDFLSTILQIQVVPLQYISCNMPLKMELLKKADILLLENLSDFKEEVANCSKFAEVLSSGVDIFVNDSFSNSHKVLASTVGVTQFCCACIAGFHFEESLCLLKGIAETSRKPYFAIIGGGNLYNKAAALQFLASRCQGLIFVGMMSFQIMHALGLSVPSNLLEHRASNEALEIVQLARDRNVQIMFPKDFWCENEHDPKQLKAFPAHGILDGWVPVDLGPTSLDELSPLLTKCKKIIWIGPVKFVVSGKYTNGASKLGKMLDHLSQTDCDITVIGSTACQIVKEELNSLSVINMLENASAVWEVLKGRKLPGVMALDRAYRSEINWNNVYSDAARPLVVDIGSGNGLFLLEMARRRKDLNFLGLEINEKLVRCCLDSVHQIGMKNGHFIATNATSTFRSIISTYPGELVLVSIQCPNPDFNKPGHRWRMLQRSLIEAIVDLLTFDGKVFLQSDVEAVTMRMKELFLRYGKGKLDLVHGQGNDSDGWLEENPFGVRSDWERHVLERGDPMYRLMFSKSPGTGETLDCK